MRLHAFGGLWVDSCRAPHPDTRSRRGLACLALLAVHGSGGISRGQAASLLWPELDQPQARRALKQLLYTLRRDLGPAVLADRETLRLDSATLGSDVADLLIARREGAAAAVAAAYSGPFLDGFHLDRSGEFERWAEAERSRFHREAGEAILALATQAEATGDLPSAIGHWRRRVELDPLESAWAIRLMEALARSGDGPGALQFAAAVQARIRLELEAGPDPAVAACADRVRRQGLSRTPCPPCPPCPPRPSGPPCPPRPPRPPRPPHEHRLSRLAVLGVTTLLVGWSTWRLEQPPVAAPAPLRVAVSPLVNQGDDTTLAAFGDLAVSWISGSLLHTGRFEVVDSRSLSGPARLRGADSDLTLARLAGASRLLHGRFSLTRDSLRMVLGVTETANGRELDSLRLTTAAGADLVQVGRLLESQVVAVLNRSAPGHRP